jgi:predicted phage terminase large subunit-like protein
MEVEVVNPPTYREYVQAAAPGFRWYRHCELIAEQLQRILDGEITRLFVNLPPRHSKSEMVSRNLPGAWFARYPESSIILTTYGAELSHDLAQEARDRYEFAGFGRIRRDARAARNWRTAEGGRMISAGVRGPIGGRGASLAIVDDYYRDDEQAQSTTLRRRTERWYDSVFETRLEEDAAIVVMSTRWHPQDLVGWLLSKESGDHAEGWTILCLPAISEEEPQRFPETCEVIEDFRPEPGLPLCPERMSLERLEHIRGRSLAYFWNALWQNNPKPEEGGRFKREWFRPEFFVERDAVPLLANRVRSWDKAGTEGGGDWTVGVLIARDSQGIYWIESVIRGQWDDLDREAVIERQAMADNQRYRTAGNGTPVFVLTEQEPGSGGRQSAAITARNLDGHDFGMFKPVTNKYARSGPLAAYVKAGLVRFVLGDWNEAFIEEFVAFTGRDGDTDDQVDAAAQGFTWLAIGADDNIRPHALPPEGVVDEWRGR